MTNSKKSLIIAGILLFIGTLTYAGHPINDFYKKHKNDQDMEAKVVPPKMAAMFVDEDYPEAIDILKSLSALKYLNYYGEKPQISNYAKKAVAAKGDYKSLLDYSEGNRNVQVFGVKKNGKVRKAIAVVQTKTQFLLIICKGKLSKRQIDGLPELSKEIQ